MNIGIHRIRITILAAGCANLFGVWAIAGCQGEPAPAEWGPVNALRQRFPEHSGFVLDAMEGFVATEVGFDAVERRAWGVVGVRLPHDGREAIRFRGFGGVEVRVREVGALGEGTLAERAVAYRRAGGSSFWTAGQGVAEEWLHLEAGVARDGEPAAAWEIEGATVRQHGEGVEVVDATGVVRLSVTAPKAYAIGGREVDVRLVASGARIALEVDAGGEEVLVDPLWTSVASMNQGREEHTATLLGNGKVLVTGGWSLSASNLASAELYDPAMNTWTTVGPMSSPRSGHTATLLDSGEVLVVGGNSGSGALASAELYDPAANTWKPAGAMNVARFIHTATLLPAGQVLVAGGKTYMSVFASAELYDRATNTWAPATPMSQPRVLHTASLLGNGKVLVVGGENNGGAVALAELFDPQAGSWAPAAAMARAWHTATLLASGEVLVAGSYNSTASADRYNAMTNQWVPAGTMNHDRFLHSATLLPGGRVLVAGGQGNGGATAELYDPATNSWAETEAMSILRSAHTATLLASGAVLVAGGLGNMMNDYASAEVYDSAPSTSSPLGSPCTAAADCASGFCADGVCCNTACDSGPCVACTLAGGAAVDGTCALLTGPACDDGDACSQTDTCQSGTCTGTNPVICAAADECHEAGVCDPSTGACVDVAKPDGSPCAGGKCEGGACGIAVTAGCAFRMPGESPRGGAWLLGLLLLPVLQRRRGAGSR